MALGQPMGRTVNIPLKVFCRNAIGQFNVVCNMQSCLARRTGPDASASANLGYASGTQVHGSTAESPGTTGAFLLRNRSSPWETKTKRRPRCTRRRIEEKDMPLSHALATPVDEITESSALVPRNGFPLEPRCRVCRNDVLRKKVNDMLAAGASYAMVLRALDE